MTNQARVVSGVDVIDGKQIDIAIWDLMSDFEKRDVKQIIDAICRLGYNRSVVDRRVDGVFKKRWFDHKGYGSNVHYILKRGVKRPLPRDHKDRKMVWNGLPLTVRELCEKMGLGSGLVIKQIIEFGHMVTINEMLPIDIIEKTTKSFGFQVTIERSVVEQEVANPLAIGPEDDDMICVWKALSGSSSGRTVTELEAALAKYPDQVHPDDIPMLLNILVVNGFVTKQGNRTDEFIYILKKGVQMAQLNNGNKAGIRVHPSKVFDHNPAGHIDLTEGIAVCLWKVVADGKGRTQDQILDILGAYGINREVAKNAFVRAKVNLDWFTWVGSNISNSVYKLKKHIKMPAIEKVDPDQLKQKLSPGGIRLNKAASSPIVSAPSLGGERGRHQFYAESGQLRLDTQKPSAEFNDVAAETIHIAAPDVKEEVVNEVKPAAPVITKDDHMDVAIWKVMSDYKPYTAAEVGMLLTEYGHKLATVRSRISVIFLYEGNWFIREQRPGARNTKEYVYTLKPDVPMPGTQKPEQPPAQAELAIDTTTQTNTEKTNDMKKAPASKVNAKTTTAMGAALSAAAAQAAERAEVTARAERETPNEFNGSAGAVPVVAGPAAMASAVAAAATPVAQPSAANDDDGISLKDLPDTELLSFQVKIRNSVYSFAQAENLTKELVASGFGQGRHSAKTTLLQTSHRIGNASFSSEELDTLAKQLSDVGFGAN